jgi:5'-3' exonuclease
MARIFTAHLVDASPYIFRAYFSLPSSMVDPQGRPVGAVYGFCSFLLKLIAEQQPTHLGVAFDRSLTTSFRNDLYPQYKAQRELPPPELEAQIDDCLEAAGALGAATFIDDRYEADDLIGSLCRELERNGHGAVVVTSDKDLAQLVSDRVGLLDYARQKRYGTAEVKEKFSVHSWQIADLLGLAGDSVDNIPGVKGVGKKTAAALLEAFGDLETLYRRLQEVPALPLRGARLLMNRLEEGREQALLSKRLATVARDAPVATDLRRLQYRGAEPAKVEALFGRLGFQHLHRRIRCWRVLPS